MEACIYTIGLSTAMADDDVRVCWVAANITGASGHFWYGIYNCILTLGDNSDEEEEVPSSQAETPAETPAAADEPTDSSLPSIPLREVGEETLVNEPESRRKK